LWPSATSFQSSTAHGRSRPMLTVMPRPRAASKRGCGRLGCSR
jgi:hypothetical protein